ncbi:S-layer homology domain-containing protein [Paenibacillus sp. CAU 1782]
MLLVPSIAFAEEVEKASSLSYLSESDYEFVIEMAELPRDTRNHWARELFLWAENNNIIHGYDDYSFRPDRYASEAELLKMIYKLFGAALPGSLGLNWSDGPYLLAKSDKLPIKAVKDESAKFKPIEGNAFLSRAEALDWLRVVSLKGIMSFYEFYEKPMESLPLEELREISVNPVSAASNFTYVPITSADLNLYNADLTAFATVRGANAT